METDRYGTSPADTTVTDIAVVCAAAHFAYGTFSRSRQEVIVRNWNPLAHHRRCRMGVQLDHLHGSTMKQEFIGADDLLTIFAQQRQALLRHTAEALSAQTDVVRPDVDPQHAKLSAIVVSSLEELKVAEEELLERTERLADLHDELERRVRGARQLFDLAPACLLVTDLYGSIIDANQATVALFRRPATQLDRQPMARFIPADDRRGFRDGLTRIAQTDGVSDWRFQLVRPTDSPLSVSAAVRVVKSHDTPGTRLFWAIRVLEQAMDIDIA